MSFFSIFVPLTPFVFLHQPHIIIINLYLVLCSNPPAYMLQVDSSVHIITGPSPVALFSSNIISLQPSNLSERNQLIELTVLRLSLLTPSPCSSFHLTWHHQPACHST